MYLECNIGVPKMDRCIEWNIGVPRWNIGVQRSVRRNIGGQAHILCVDATLWAKMYYIL